MQSLEQRTVWGYAATRILDTPFWGMYALLPFILYRDLGATPFQIAVLVTLKPLSSILSSYWGSFVHERPDRLVASIVWARACTYLAYFFLPFVSNPWYFIAAHGLHTMFEVGSMPAWMEILKMNLKKEKREKLFAYSQAFGYLGGGLFPFLIGYLLDGYYQAWRWLFPLTAFLGLMAIFFQRKMHVMQKREAETKSHAPFKAALSLLQARPDFTQFQLAFMIIGSGILVMQPAIPLFFVDILHLSYTEMAIALTLCKGFGYALTAPMLSKLLAHTNIFRFSATMANAAAIFPMVLICAKWEINCLYIAYILYGIAQSGSEFAWNMSGPIFSKDKDSSLFSSINLASVGLRGALMPPLGSLILTFSSSLIALSLGGAFCLLGSLFMKRTEQKEVGFKISKL
jgi:predicted MFS family arabinose efflux permease